MIPYHGDDITTQSLLRQIDVRKIISKIMSETNIETPALYELMCQRRSKFSVGQSVLVWSEFVLGKRKLKTGNVYAKLKRSWQRAIIISVSGEIYFVRLDDGTSRRCHRRQMKPM